MAMKKYLTLALAKKIAEAVEKKARELGVEVALSIVDEGGNLKAFRRMDKTSCGSIRISHLKATTSASLPISTKALGEKNAKLPNNPYGGGSIPGIILLGGGLPILTSDGSHLGGIGISGATPEMDEACAQAGLDAIREELG